MCPCWCYDDPEAHGDSVPFAGMYLEVRRTLWELGGFDDILFDGLVADTDQNSSELFVSWSSSVDGVLFEGYPNAMGQSIVDYSELSGGSHIITLSVTDQQMLTSSDSISVSINTPPETPVISISPMSP